METSWINLQDDASAKFNIRTSIVTVQDQYPTYRYAIFPEHLNNHYMLPLKTSIYAVGVRIRIKSLRIRKTAIIF